MPLNGRFLDVKRVVTVAAGDENGHVCGPTSPGVIKLFDPDPVKCTDLVLQPVVRQ